MKLELSQQKWGIIGGSQGMGLWFYKFLCHCLNEETVKFSSLGAESQFVDNVALCQWADVIIIAVPIHQVTNILDEISDVVTNQLLIDLSSVKEFVFQKMDMLRQKLNKPFDHFSLHPIFAPSIYGWENEIMVELENTAPLSSRNQRIKDEFCLFLREQGLQMPLLSAQNHDKDMAIVQSLNHFTLFVGAKTLAHFSDDIDATKKITSPPYRIFILFFTRYVSQNPSLYADIQMYNHYSLLILAQFKNTVEQLYDIVSKKDKVAFIHFVEQMQDFYRKNSFDAELSSYLIDALKERISDQSQWL